MSDRDAYIRRYALYLLGRGECPKHSDYGLSYEQSRKCERPALDLSYDWDDCEHLSSSGIDGTPRDDLHKVWRCDECERTYRLDLDENGIAHMVFFEAQPDKSLISRKEEA